MSEIVWIDPHSIRVPEVRARSTIAQSLRILMEDPEAFIPNEEEVKAFLRSIELEGIKEPVTLFKDREDNLWLAHGESRLRVACKLQLKTIPARIVIGDEREAMMYSLTTSIQGKRDLVSLAFTASSLEKMGISKTEIARRLGVDRDYIYSLLSVVQTTTHIQELVARGKLYPSHVRQLQRIEDDVVKESLADIVVRNEWSREKVKEFIDEMERQRKEYGYTWKDAYSEVWKQVKYIGMRNVCNYCHEAIARGEKVVLRRFHERCWEDVRIKSELERDLPLDWAQCPECKALVRVRHEKHEHRFEEVIEKVEEREAA